MIDTSMVVCVQKMMDLERQCGCISSLGVVVRIVSLESGRPLWFDSRSTYPKAVLSSLIGTKVGMGCITTDVSVSGNYWS